MSGSENWIEVGLANSIEREGVIRFDYGGGTFAIYRSLEDEYFATDGHCTHEKVHLSTGFVMDNEVECPKHGGRFDFKTGAPLGAPVCIALRTYPVKVEAGTIFLKLS